MGLINFKVDLSGFDSWIADAVNAKLREIEERYEKEEAKAYDEAALIFFKEVESRYKQMFMRSVRAFYSGYTPVHYERNESLYNLLATEVYDDENYTYLRRDYLFDEMTTYRSGSSGTYGETETLFQTVFEEGWHGGAMHGPGHPEPYNAAYWRQPYMKYTRWSLTPAEREDVSPLDDFNNRIKRLEASSWYDDYYTKLVNDRLAKIRIQ